MLTVARIDPQRTHPSNNHHRHFRAKLDLRQAPLHACSSGMIRHWPQPFPSQKDGEAARRFNIDRSAISRAVRRVAGDSGLIAAAETALGLLK